MELGVNRKTDRRNLRVLLIGLVLVGVAVCGLFLFRSRALSQNAQTETERYLGEISQHISDLVDERIHATFLCLETTAEAYAKLSDRDTGYAYLRTVCARYGFARMGVAEPGGDLVTTDGNILPLSGLPGIEAALEGREEVTDVLSSPVDGEPIVAYCVPIRKGEKIIGALTAVSTQEVLQDFLGVESFGGEGFSGIINGAGELITTTANSAAAAATEGSFFALLESGEVDAGYSAQEMRGDMARRASGMMSYTLVDGIHKLMIYTPLAVSDWYLLTVVPHRVATAEIRQYTHTAAVVDAAVIGLFVLLLAVVAGMFRQAERRMERLAFVDPVTGGPNRTAFERDAAALLAAAPPGTYALVSMDLQDFKLINETYGSEAGDKTLGHVYRVLAGQMGEGELAARVSGDVFSLLLKNTARQSMDRRMEDLAEEVNRFNLDREEKYYLPMCQGVYVVAETDPNMIVVQDRANLARKSNKQVWLGRLNACAFYDELRRERMRREKDMDNRMEGALERGEFVVYLQPKVELRWDTVAGAEALVRWTDGERGVVPPDEFIPLFEQNGFITRLDRYVFEQVCILQRKWLDQGRKPIPVSVNLSRGNLENPDFLEEYVRIRDKYRVPDGLLELEITETLFLENEKPLLALMERIQQAGFLCSLDDFGSGYSSLSLLREMPVDALKLDRRFFFEAERDKRGEHVVQSVVELARRLKMRTVCEGVERIGQLAFLRRIQCDIVQGYVFSPPVPVEEFEALAFSGQALTPAEWEAEDALTLV